MLPYSSEHIFTLSILDLGNPHSWEDYIYSLPALYGDNQPFVIWLFTSELSFKDFFRFCGFYFISISAKRNQRFSSEKKVVIYCTSFYYFQIISDLCSIYLYPNVVSICCNGISIFLFKLPIDFLICYPKGSLSSSSNSHLLVRSTFSPYHYMT